MTDDPPDFIMMEKRCEIVLGLLHREAARFDRSQLNQLLENVHLMEKVIIDSLWHKVHEDERT